MKIIISEGYDENYFLQTCGILMFNVPTYNYYEIKFDIDNINTKYLDYVINLD